MTATQHKKPRLRFPEFREDWCLDEIKDYLEEYIERVPSSTGLPVLTSSRSGLFLQKDYFKDRELANEGEYGVLPYGYITYRHMSDDSTFIFNINYLVESGVVSKEYPVFKTNGMDIYFLQQVLNHGKAFKRFATEQKKGGTRTRLYFKNLLRFRVHLPPLPEQQKIATFLSTIDTRIQQLSRKKALLEQYKKGVMQQIFSQEIRFKDDDGKEFPAWEEKKLKEMTQIVTGGTPSTLIKEYWKGNIRWMNSGELNLKKVYEVEGRITKKGLENSSTKIVPAFSVLVGLAGQGRTRGTTAINMIDLSINQSIAAILPNDSVFVSEFIYYNLDFRYNELRKISAGDGGRGGLNLQMIKSIKISLPCLFEQKRIVDFFSSIDVKIDQIENQLKYTQTFKKGLLQQMFV